MAWKQSEEEGGPVFKLQSGNRLFNGLLSLGAFVIVGVSNLLARLVQLRKK